MDLETMVHPDGQQVPVFISFASSTHTEFFLLQEDLDLKIGINDL